MRIIYPYNVASGAATVFETVLVAITDADITETFSDSVVVTEV